MTLTRRGAFLGAAVLACGPRDASAQVPAFSGIAVDVGPLRAQGMGPYADTVRANLQAALASAFAGRIARSGPKLVVRLDGVSLRSYVGRDGPRGFGSTPNDYMEGEALVIGPGNAVLDRRHQLSAVPASSGGAWYLPDAEERRLAAVCAHFAGWLARQI